MTWLLAALVLVTGGTASLRWLRVAQREHYAPGRVTLFAGRWAVAGQANQVLTGVAVLAGLVALVPGVPAAVGAVACLVVLVAPIGLGLRGRTSPLVWSRRMRVLAGVVAVLELGLGAVVLALPAVVGVAAVVQPLVVDLALAITGPLERVASARWVRQASRRLDRVGPTVVGITGSFGKTTVKNYTDHLVSGTRTTIASRKSFNNRLGLARSINTDLAPGTEVFIAEMGTYGRGEIAELCSWCRPTVAAITAIGPVHLERMGSLDGIVEAKSEILERAEVAVLNVDDERLAVLADRVEARGQQVVRCGSQSPGQLDVRVVDDGETLRAEVGDDAVEIQRPDSVVVATNVAVALGICVGLGTMPPGLERALASLPQVENRLTISETPDGPTIIDDTYNANPAGTRVALARLEEVMARRSGGRGVVITPGMVELGPRQEEDNAGFACEVAGLGVTLVVVGRTNETALVRGYEGCGGDDLVRVRDRDGAVAWLRRNVGPEDVVLFENDLPDHFP